MRFEIGKVSGSRPLAASASFRIGTEAAKSAIREPPDPIQPSARRELLRWFTDVYRNPSGTDLCGIHGTPEQVRERLEEMVGMGANHLMLNPVSRYTEQVEALAEVVGLK